MYKSKNPKPVYYEWKNKEEKKIIEARKKRYKRFMTIICHERSMADFKKGQN